MANYKIVENDIMEKLNSYFMTEFRFLYEDINITGKNVIIKYISSFFRKWYYSTFIEDTVITPSYIAKYASKEDNIYPVLKCKAVSRIVNYEINCLKYTLDNHPMCVDFRKVVRYFNKGVHLDDDLQMDFADIKKIGDISSYDMEYISYLIMLAIDLNFVEKMPSLGVTMYCASKKARELSNVSNRELLNQLVDTAFKIAATYLSDDFLGEKYIVSIEKVKEWIKNPIPVDKIFENTYGELAIEMSDSFLVDNMDEMERHIMAKAYARGVIIDRWLLTPFSYYFKFIDLTYMFEYSFYDEMMFLINASIVAEETGDESAFETAVYSPCTIFSTTNLGKEYFELPIDENVPELFKKMSADEIFEGVAYDLDDVKEKIMKIYEPDLTIYTLEVSDNKSNRKFSMNVRDDMTLDVLNANIANAFKTSFIICQSYRFYKLPESPFTEYAPVFMGLRGPHTEDTMIKNVLNLGEKFYYEIVKVNEDEELESKVYTIKLEAINSNQE